MSKHNQKKQKSGSKFFGDKKEDKKENNITRSKKHRDKKHNKKKQSEDNKSDDSKEKHYTGYMEIKKNGHGKVSSNELDADIFIFKKNMGNSFDGDEVEFILKPTPDMKGVEGKVTNVLKRNTTEYAAEVITIDEHPFVRCENGMKVKLREFKVSSYRDVKGGTIVIVSIDDWKSPAKGHVVEVLGHKSEPHVTLQRIARKYGFIDSFSKEAYDEISSYSQELIDAQISHRTDITNEDVFTVDPTDAKDFDDAISIKKNDDNSFDLGVHIADVSFFVTEKSALDKEALKSAFSLYLPSSVIPMLPKQLSNYLCSLNPDTNRLALSCFMHVSKSGKVESYKFKETVMNSKMRFDYKTFQNNLDRISNGKELLPKYEKFKEIFKWSKELKDILKNRRVKEGSIEFSLPEVKIDLNEKGEVLNIYTYKLYEANNVIEEFMLAANKCAASFIDKRKHKIPGVYRIHGDPSYDKIMEFFLELEKNNIKISTKGDILAHSFIQDMLKKLKEAENGDFLISHFLRSMMKAKYSTENIGHYGLAFDLYTHFTSPIRRYPDLMVHRIIKKHLGTLSIQKKYDNAKDIEKKCKYISIREIKSIKAGYEARDVKIAEFLYGKIGKSFSGVVISVTPFGAYVKLREYPVEGMLHVSRQTDDKYIYNAEKNILKGSRKGNEIFVGKDVDIMVLAVDKELLLIDFKLLP